MVLPPPPAAITSQRHDVVARRPRKREGSPREGRPGRPAHPSRRGKASLRTERGSCRPGKRQGQGRAGQACRERASYLDPLPVPPPLRHVVPVCSAGDVSKRGGRGGGQRPRERLREPAEGRGGCVPSVLQWAGRVRVFFASALSAGSQHPCRGAALWWAAPAQTLLWAERSGSFLAVSSPEVVWLIRNSPGGICCVSSA